MRQGNAVLSTVLLCAITQTRAFDTPAQHRASVGTETCFNITLLQSTTRSNAPRFDNADVVAHIYRQLAREGYSGIPIHSLFR